MFKTYRTFNLNTGVKNKKLAVVGTPKETFVVLHETIVVHQKGNKVTLNNGGWDTVSTRLVINKALVELGSKYYLYRSKHVTYIGSYNNNETTEKTEFVNGMTLSLFR